jgi:adenylosuccinate lyase
MTNISGKTDLARSALFAISPVDGRYSDRTSTLREFFSEYALIRARCLIELDYLNALEQTRIFSPLTTDEKARIQSLSEGFNETHALRVKEIEATTKHDVKAVEYFLCEFLQISEPNRIHFGLTSEDVNNLSWSMLLKNYRDTVQVPQLKKLAKTLADRVTEGIDTVFPTRTHGQFASPSTAGKEMAVFLTRLCNVLDPLSKHKFKGKLNGATGTFSASLSAAPNINWMAFSQKFVESLGFEFNGCTTQIEDHDSWALYFSLTRQSLNILTDINQDMWLYLMQGLYKEKSVVGEVGSSTMPHKINPIRFENSEGNALFANAQLSFLSDKLTRSRMQRDLSDSTVTRTVGVALAHGHLAVGETIAGFSRLVLNRELCLQTVQEHPEILAEPVQTILRRFGAKNPYEALKALTRGRSDSSSAFAPENLPLFSNAPGIAEENKAAVENLLMNLKPELYYGAAIEVAKDALVRCEKWIRKDAT